MAACTFQRVDSINENTGAHGSTGKFSTGLIWVESEQRIFLAWFEYRRLRFAKYDPVTNTTTLETNIHGDGSTTLVDTCGMVRLSNGNLVVVFWQAGAGNSKSFSCISTDSGVTWGAPVAISQVNEFPAAVCVDGGDNVYFLVAAIGGPTGFGDLQVYKRPFTTGIWVLLGKIYNSGGAGVAPGSWNNVQEEQITNGMIMKDTEVGFVVGWRCTDGGTSLNKLTCLRTVSGWIGQVQVELATYTAIGAGNVQLLRTSTDRVYLLAHNPDANEKPDLFYTDDWGENWTRIGCPPIVSSTMTSYGIVNLDEDFDSGFCLDAQENVIFCHGTQNVLPTGHHLSYRGGAVAADWVLVGDCSYTQGVDSWASSTIGHSVIVSTVPTINTTLYRLCSMARGGGVYHTLEFLRVPDAGIIPDLPELDEEGEQRFFRKGIIQAERSKNPAARRAAGSFSSWKKIPDGTGNRRG